MDTDVAWYPVQDEGFVLRRGLILFNNLIS